LKGITISLLRLKEVLLSPLIDGLEDGPAFVSEMGVGLGLGAGKFVSLEGNIVSKLEGLSLGRIFGLLGDL